MPRARRRPRSRRQEPVAAEPGTHLIEFVSSLAGRAAFPADAYRAVPQPGDGRTVDVCAGCEVDCCSSHTVPLTVVDAHRLRRALTLPWSEFVELVPYRAESPTWPVRLNQGRAQLALRRRRRSCVFLLRLGEHRRCGIHGLRPMACRLFPFIADRGAQQRAPAGMLAQRPPRDCPWRWPIAGETSAGLFALIEEDRRARELDQEVLRIWYRQLDLSRTADNFFAFLDEEMGRRARGESGPGRWVTSLW
ncbi:MAG: YkgJ family cysteine cluster protein [Deltaproteobacteria bacterium]|nr:YkgJ family cysteine cluster protein [Deltaproteobacteria bacterium]